MKLEYQGQIRTSISDLKIITQTFKLCLAQKEQGKGQTKLTKIKNLHEQSTTIYTCLKTEYHHFVFSF